MLPFLNLSQRLPGIGFFLHGEDSKLLGNLVHGLNELGEPTGTALPWRREW
jgi:hypothetical protein